MLRPVYRYTSESLRPADEGGWIYICVIWEGRMKFQLRRSQITLRDLGKTTGVVAIAAVVLGGVLIISPRGQAFDREHEEDQDPRIQQGLEIAPVPLNLD